MSVLFDITHITHYRFHTPVTLSEHRVMFRPRGSHDLRVLATDMVITPEPVNIRLIQDVYSNSVAIVQPTSPANELRIECTFTVEHAGTRAMDLPLDARVQHHPFAYSVEDSFALTHYMAPYYDDPTGQLQVWAQQFVSTDGSTGTRELLAQMNAFIRNTMRYQARFEEGVQTPYETLQRQSGTCRDFATLMIEAVRRLGYAARFVSGYLYCPDFDTGAARPDNVGATQPPLVGVGATHAWVQVYLPGAGWLPFDPTNNLVGGSDLIRVGVARHASLASPVSGSWNGRMNDFAGLFVDVQVRRRS